MVVATAAALAMGGVGYLAGRRAGLAKRAQTQPKGPAVLIEDMAKMCKRTHSACNGTGVVKKGGGFALCPKAEARFLRRYQHAVVEWHDELFWRAPRP